ISLRWRRVADIKVHYEMTHYVLPSQGREAQIRPETEMLAPDTDISSPMPDDLIKSSKRVLEPHERISEVLFGLIMVLTFTGSLSVAEAGRGEVRTMLVGALGCQLAWGVTDRVLYLMGSLARKGPHLEMVPDVPQE